MKRERSGWKAHLIQKDWGHKDESHYIFLSQIFLFEIIFRLSFSAARLHPRERYTPSELSPLSRISVIQDS